MANRIVWQPMRELTANSIIATYQPLVDPNDSTVYGITTLARQFIIHNDTDQPVYVSFSAPIGSDDSAVTYRQIFCPSKFAFTDDIATNKFASSKDDGQALAKGTIVTVRRAGSAPTAGNSVYFSYWCSSGDL